MPRNLSYIFLTLIAIVSCSKDEEESGLDGVYALTSAIVEPIDVNVDGIISEDLFDELDCLAKATNTASFQIEGETYNGMGGVIWSPILDENSQQTISWVCGNIPDQGGTVTITILDQNSFRIFDNIYVKRGNTLTVENNDYSENSTVPWIRAVYTKK